MLRRDKSDRCCVHHAVCVLGLVVVLFLSGLTGCGGDDDETRPTGLPLACQSRQTRPVVAALPSPAAPS